MSSTAVNRARTTAVSFGSPVPPRSCTTSDCVQCVCMRVFCRARDDKLYEIVCKRWPTMQANTHRVNRGVSAERVIFSMQVTWSKTFVWKSLHYRMHLVWNGLRRLGPCISAQALLCFNSKSAAENEHVWTHSWESVYTHTYRTAARAASAATPPTTFRVCM